ncbi:hypothetical protein D3C76_1664910 [compost metagenome]
MILHNLSALAKSWLGIKNPVMPVIATITTTAGDRKLAFTAASPTIRPPTIETV